MKTYNFTSNDLPELSALSVAQKEKVEALRQNISKETNKPYVTESQAICIALLTDSSFLSEVCDDKEKAKVRSMIFYNLVDKESYDNIFNIIKTLCLNEYGTYYKGFEVWRIAEQTTQVCLQRSYEKLHEFEGRAKFQSWVISFWGHVGEEQIRELYKYDSVKGISFDANEKTDDISLGALEELLDDPDKIAMKDAQEMESTSDQSIEDDLPVFNENSDLSFSKEKIIEEEDRSIYDENQQEQEHKNSQKKSKKTNNKRRKISEFVKDYSPEASIQAISGGGDGDFETDIYTPTSLTPEEIVIRDELNSIRRDVLAEASETISSQYRRGKILTIWLKYANLDQIRKIKRARNEEKEAEGEVTLQQIADEYNQDPSNLDNINHNKVDRVIKKFQEELQVRYKKAIAE